MKHNNKYARVNKYASIINTDISFGPKTNATYALLFCQCTILIYEVLQDEKKLPFKTIFIYNHT